MFATLAYRFDLARPHISDALIGSAEVQKIRSIASHLPVSLSAALLFECRLSADAPQVDFSLGLDPDAWVAQHEAVGDSVVSLSDRFATLRPVQSLCDAWTTIGTTVHEAISAVSLEYDAPETRDRTVDASLTMQHEAPPVPAVFVKIRSLDPVQGGPNEKKRVLAHRLNTALRQLFPAQDAPRCFDARLPQCLDALPSEARLTWVARMLSREDERIRLCVSRLDPDAIHAFLNAIEWPGNPQCVADQARELDALGADLMLAFDLGAEVGERLGLELRMPGPLPRRGVGEELSPYAPLLTYFYERGLCTAEKRQAALKWCGAIRVPGTHAETAALFFHNELMKLVYRADGGREVKLYPGLRYRDVTRKPVPS